MKYQHRFGSHTDEMTATNIDDAIIESDSRWGFPPRTTIKIIIGDGKAWYRTSRRGWQRVEDYQYGGDLQAAIDAMLRCHKAYQLV